VPDKPVLPEMLYHALAKQAGEGLSRLNGRNFLGEVLFVIVCCSRTSVKFLFFL